MQIDQYHRRVPLEGSAGNVITGKSNSYGELENIGRTFTELGFAAEQQILQARYYNEKSKLQLAMDQAYQKHEEGLDPNDTDNWVPSLEKLQETYPDLMKIKSSRLRAEATTLIEDAKLRQRNSLFNYKRVVDSRNIGREWQANYNLSLQTLSKMPVDTPALYEAEKAKYMESMFGYKLKEGAKEVTWANLEPVEDFDNPAMISDEVRKKEAQVWLERLGENREDYLAKDEYERALTFVQAEANTDASLEAIDKAIDKGGKWGRFPRLDTGALQALRANAQSATARRNQETIARAEQFESDVTNALLKGQLTMPVDGRQESVRDLIINNRDLDKWPEKKRALVSMYDSTVSGMGKGASDNDPYALAEAYKVMASDLNKQQKFTKLMELKPKLKSTTVDGFIQDIYKPETVSNEIYKQYSSAINSLKTGKMFSSDITQNVNLSVKAQDLLRMFAEKNPDATEEDYAKFFNRLIENQARWWAILPGGRPWSGRREKAELRLSIPQNIGAMQKEMAARRSSAGYKAGDTRTVNGVTYTYDGQYWTD